MGTTEIEKLIASDMIHSAVKPIHIKPDQSEWAKGYIRSLTLDRFYGKLTLIFEMGKIVIVKKEETIKV